ncbi:hypothetical protein LXL04_008290 [Taraxacum kok-saghyz]
MKISAKLNPKHIFRSKKSSSVSRSDPSSFGSYATTSSASPEPSHGHHKSTYSSSWCKRSGGLVNLGSERKQEEEDEVEKAEYSPRVYNSEMAAYMAASTMTAVVAAPEKEKQEAARDLQSLDSSPCEWFICDDSSIYTRCFVIQGLDSVASWQANLFFEPTKFEVKLKTNLLLHIRSMGSAIMKAEEISVTQFVEVQNLGMVISTPVDAFNILMASYFETNLHHANAAAS